MFDGVRIKDSLYYITLYLYICIVYVGIYRYTDETIWTQIGQPTGRKNKKLAFLRMSILTLEFSVAGSEIGYIKFLYDFPQRESKITADDTAEESRKCNFDAVAPRKLWTRHEVHLKHNLYCILYYYIVCTN